MKTVLFLSLFAALSLPAMAKEAPSRSKYELLEKRYDASKVPASAQDFDLEGAPSDQTCLMVNYNNQDKLIPVALKRLEVRFDPGPLFPRPETRITFYTERPKDVMASFWDLQLGQVETDLIIGYSDGSVGRGEIFARKYGTVVVFRLRNYLGSYGYCFRTNGN